MCMYVLVIFRMLEEILGTRIMVKNSMKQHKGNKVRTCTGQGIGAHILARDIQEAVIILG